MKRGRKPSLSRRTIKRKEFEETIRKIMKKQTWEIAAELNGFTVNGRDIDSLVGGHWISDGIVDFIGA